jgi:hypothetical protein
MQCFESVLRWIHCYTEIHTEEAGSVVDAEEAEKHQIFYALVQVLFEVFHRRKDEFGELLEESPKLVEFLDFPAVLNSDLNPLRFCSPSVVKKFAAAASELAVADCSDLLAHNESFAQLRRARPHENFPFQRYRLQHSKAVIEAILRR